MLLLAVIRGRQGPELGLVLGLLGRLVVRNESAKGPALAGGPGVVRRPPPRLPPAGGPSLRWHPLGLGGLLLWLLLLLALRLGGLLLLGRLAARAQAGCPQRPRQRPAAPEPDQQRGTVGSPPQATQGLSCLLSRGWGRWPLVHQGRGRAGGTPEHRDRPGRPTAGQAHCWRCGRRPGRPFPHRAGGIRGGRQRPRRTRLLLLMACGRVWVED